MKITGRYLLPIIYTLLFTSILLYMFGGASGLIPFIIIAFIVSGYKGAPKIYRWLVLCIISLPLSFIGILGMEMTHMINWTIIIEVILIFSITFTYGFKMAFNAKEILVLLLTLGTLIFIAATTYLTIKTIVDVIQILIFLLPIVSFFNIRNRILLAEDYKDKLIDIYVNVVTITSISIIIQWILYNFIGTEIGYVSLFSLGRRVVFNGLYKGMSVMSIFLGSGFVFLVIYLSHKTKKRGSIIKMALILLGILVNTSRTGLAGIAIALLLYYAKTFSHKIKAQTVLLGGVGVFGIVYVVRKMSSVRGNILDDNGRFLTWIDGINIWKSSMKNLLFGAGFEDSIWKIGGGMTSHNMLIQSLAQCGAIGTLLFIALFLMYYKVIKHSDYRFVVYYFIITGMMVTDFYANPFTAIAMCLIILCASNYTMKIQ